MGRGVESAGMPFRIANGKSQMPNLKSEICDNLRFEISRASEDQTYCLSLE